MLVFNFVKLLNHLLGNLAGLVDVMRHVVLVTGYIENVGVKCWHARLDVVEQECLKKIGSMKLHWNLKEEVGDGEPRRFDFILNKLRAISHSLKILKVESLYSFDRKSIATKWIHTELTLVDIVDYHD